MKKVANLFLLVIFPTASFASVMPCVAGPVSSIEFSTCSIGSLIYTFENARVSTEETGGGITYPTIPGFSTSALTFTPEPASNGFIISGNISVNAPAGTFIEGYLLLQSTFATDDSLPWVTGVTTGFIGTASGNGVSGAFTEFNQVDAASDGLNGPLNPAYAQDGTGTSYCPNPAVPCTVSFLRGPVSATDFEAGQAVLGLDADNQNGLGGPVTLTSGEFFVDGIPGGDINTPSVPEPGSYVLALSGILGFLGLHKLVSSQRNGKLSRR